MKVLRNLFVSVIFFLLNVSFTNSFSASSSTIRESLFQFKSIPSRKFKSCLPRVSDNHLLKTASSSTIPAEPEEATPNNTPSKPSLSQIRKEGGITAFNTPLGALNLYGIYYGMIAIGLGLIWFMGILSWQIVHFLSGKRIDKKHAFPIFIAQIWGRATMFLTFQDPKYVNYEILKAFYKEKTKRAAMFVANHNSWQDIPFVGATIGWNNYKFIAKKELLKVPILGSAMSAGGHVLVDRTNRRSQLMTLKAGIEWLKNGVHLCTFPEGTRSKTGRLIPFKNGAFKMAFKANAPVIPLSVCGADKVQPAHWMFPMKTARNVKVIVHQPVECEGKTEDEVAQIVREKIIEGLPEDQKPLEEFE